MDKQAEIARIKAEYEARNREIDRQHRQEMAKIIGGGLLQGASFHPIFNIPYVGTGLGGAMFEAGNAIMQGKSGKDILSDTGKGFVVGETIGAIPYAGKGLSKTKVGQVVAKGADDLVKRLADTPIAQKVEDILLTDVTGKSVKGYHGTKYKGNINKFDENLIGSNTGNEGYFGKGFYFTNEKDYAKKFGDNIVNANLRFSKPYKIDNTTNIDEIKKMVETNSDYSDLGGNTLADNALWYISENPNKFRDNLIKNGYDGVIVDGTRNEIVAFSPDQIDIRKLQNYSKNINMGTFINALLNEQE